jgi:S1-C subfamily serine protease
VKLTPLLALVVAGCALLGPREHLASPGEVEASFAPHRDLLIAGEPARDFLRRRTAALVGGVDTLRVEADDGRLSPAMRLSAGEDGALAPASAALGAAAAISADGYFLTAAHGLGAGPVHLLIETPAGVASAPARVLWWEAARDVALLHAPLRPAGWFALLPDRVLAAGETLLSHGPLEGAAAGVLEVTVDLPALAPYETLALPHDMPLCAGFSGSPAVTTDGLLLGVNTSTGMDTVFRRRSWLARVEPGLLARLMESDRRARP